MSKQYREPKTLAAVQKFHELFGAYIWEKPHIPSKDLCDLRINLLQEEMDELKEAIAAWDLVEIADALTDIQYVLSGAVLAFGMWDIFADLFDEVQRSNMSKACDTKDDAEQTVQKYSLLDQPASLISKEEKFLVLRDEDNKVLKSVNYSPANLESIVQPS